MRQRRLNRTKQEAIIRAMEAQDHLEQRRYTFGLVVAELEAEAASLERDSAACVTGVKERLQSQASGIRYAVAQFKIGVHEDVPF